MSTMTAKSKKKARTGRVGSADVAADYLQLVRRFPLRPIRTRDLYDRAMPILRDLLGRADDPGLSAGEGDYADVLVRLIREYDEKHSSILVEARKLSPIQALRYLMEEHGMNTISLGKLIGGSGQASLILNGKRELSKANMRTLANHFKVSPALFL